MAEYDNSGKVSLWANESENPRAPRYKGKVYAHRDIAKGDEVSVSLWQNESENPKAPVLTGKMEDKRTPENRDSQRGDASQKPAEAAPKQDEFIPDSDIPF